MTGNRWMVLLAAIAGAGLVAVACGGDNNSGGAACTQDSDCSSGQICHPLAKFCVQTCTQASDCPSTENNCAPLTTSAGTTSQSVCQCTGDASCGGGSNICGTEDHVCEVKCAQDSDCSNSGRKCDTASGQCVTQGQQQGTCNSSNTTIGSNGGPDTCNYGSFCASDNTCAAAPQGSCSEASAGTGSTWDGKNHSAPVITQVTAAGSATSNSSNQCSDGGPMTVFTVDYYVPGGLTSQTAFSSWRNNVWSALNGAANFTNADFSGGLAPPVGQDFGRLSFGVCGAQTGEAAVYITNDANQSSNVVCVTW